MTLIKRTVMAGAATALTAAALVLTGCTAPTLPGSLGQLQAVAATCPTGGQKLASLVAVDGSDAVSDQRLAAQRLVVIDQVAERTLLCGGHLQVVGFSTSSATNATIYDARLPTLPGATIAARVREAGPILKNVDAQIAKAYQPALATLPTTATDVVGELRLAAEYKQALGPGYVLDTDLLTDGLQDEDFDLYQPLTPAQAKTIAGQVSVPNLVGATVTMAGLGQVYDPPVSSAVATSLVNFYTDLLARTHAAHVLAVTNLPKGA